MSKERELLQKILTAYREDKSCMSWGVANEIQELLAQPEPFTPDWVNYRQGVEDATREPLSDEEIGKICKDHFFVASLSALIKTVEKAHGIGVDDE